jgi:hypothetical protein
MKPSASAALFYAPKAQLAAPQVPRLNQGNRKVWAHEALFSLRFAGCPILAASLFLRQGWESTNLNQPCFERARL